MTDPNPQPEQGDAATTPEEPATEAPAAGFGAHPVVVYTLKRLLLLLVVGGVCWLVGLRGVWLILFAFLISGAIAMVALKDSREGAAYGITTAVQKANDRIEASTKVEDSALDDDLDESGAVVAEPRRDDDEA